MSYMNSRWGNLTLRWWKTVWGDSRSTVDWGEFRPIITDFSSPLIPLGHFYDFFSYLIAAVSCLLIYAHWQGSTARPRETVPSTLPFFLTLFFLCPLSSSLCHHWASLHSIYLELPFLVSNKTLLTHKTLALWQHTHIHISLLLMHLQH